EKHRPLRLLHRRVSISSGHAGTAAALQPAAQRTSRPRRRLWFRYGYVRAFESTPGKEPRLRKIDAFDLTPALLARFQSELQIRRIPRVQLQQADVLALDALPPSWTNYDLIVSASMLEYLPKQDLSRALAGLHARLAPHGQILVAAYFLLRIAARSLPHHIQFICSDDCVFAVPRAAPHAVARERNDHLGRAYPRLQQAR